MAKQILALNKVFNKTEIARLYHRRFGKVITTRYIHYLLDPSDKKHKNVKRLEEIKQVIEEDVLKLH